MYYACVVGRTATEPWTTTRVSGMARLETLGFPMALVVLSAACAPAADSPADWALAEGGTLGSVFRGASAGVVLVLDPSHCFSCTNLLTQWLDWRASYPERFRLVLSRPPLNWEKVRLAPLPIDGTLSVPRDLREFPVELALAGGKVIYRSPVLLGVSTSPLLAELRDTTLVEALGRLRHGEAEFTGAANGRPHVP